jgi:hypothetical protein
VAKYVAALLTVEADSGDRLAAQLAGALRYRTNGFVDVAEMQVAMEGASAQQRQMVEQEHQEQAAQLQALQQGGRRSPRLPCTRSCAGCRH